LFDTWNVVSSGFARGLELHAFVGGGRLDERLLLSMMMDGVAASNAALHLLSSTPRLDRTEIVAAATLTHSVVPAIQSSKQESKNPRQGRY
jgi:hypothetical protein